MNIRKFRTAGIEPATFRFTLKLLQSNALPTELCSDGTLSTGIEPVTLRLTVVRSTN